ncbi:MAG: metallophosphoesterase [Dehalococcoidia bacterium]
MSIWVRPIGLAALGVAVVLVTIFVGVSRPVSARPTEPPPAIERNDQNAAAPIVLWTQLVGGAAISARALITPAGPCPAIETAGETLTMAVRGPHTFNAGLGFPQVCERVLPASVATATLAGRPLALFDGDASAIVVIGDTGCRINGADQQACNDAAANPYVRPQGWPFAQIISSAVAAQPDLVIHVGDYVYREGPCTTPGCAGSSYGHGWDAWWTDVIAPMQPLLPRAPWLFVRGNHELCARGGAGWFLLFDPRPLPDTCSDFSPPNSVTLSSTLNAIVFDAAAADDSKAGKPPHGDDEKSTLPIYRGYFEQAATMASDNTWFIVHAPIWGVNRTGSGHYEYRNATLQAALAEATRHGLPEGVQIVLSGHIHIFEMLSFLTSKHSPPAQFVIGNSGTELSSPAMPFPLKDAGHAFGHDLATGLAIYSFGFSTIEPAGSAFTWTLTSRDADGTSLSICSISGRSAACRNAPVGGTLPLDLVLIPLAPVAGQP